MCWDQSTGAHRIHNQTFRSFVSWLLNTGCYLKIKLYVLTNHVSNKSNIYSTPIVYLLLDYLSVLSTLVSAFMPLVLGGGAILLRNSVIVLLFSTPISVTTCWPLENGHDGIVCTTTLASGINQDSFFSPSEAKNLLTLDSGPLLVWNKKWEDWSERRKNGYWQENSSTPMNKIY